MNVSGYKWVLTDISEQFSWNVKTNGGATSKRVALNLLRVDSISDAGALKKCGIYICQDLSTLICEQITAAALCSERKWSD